MGQSVTGFFDLGRGLVVGDPREDEARSREASSRAERALRAQIAAQAMSMASRGGGGYSMQGSPNGPGSETAQRGHAISNPWNRPDSRPQVSGGFAANNAPNRPFSAFTGAEGRGGVSVQSTDYAPRWQSTQGFDGNVRPERDAILAQIEGNRQRKFAEDQVLADRAFKEKDAVAQREHATGLAKMEMSYKGQALEADKSHKARALQAQIAQAGAERRDTNFARNQAQTAKDQQEALTVAGPLLDKMRKGNFDDDLESAIMSQAPMMSPGAKRALLKLISEQQFGDAVVKNNSYDISRPLHSLEMLFRDAAGRRLDGSINPLSPVETPALRRSRSEWIRSRLISALGEGSKPVATPEDPYEAAMLRAILQE